MRIRLKHRGLRPEEEKHSRGGRGSSWQRAQRLPSDMKSDPGLAGGQLCSPLFKSARLSWSRFPVKGIVYCPFSREAIQPGLNVGPGFSDTLLNANYKG